MLILRRPRTAKLPLERGKLRLDVPFGFQALYDVLSVPPQKVMKSMEFLTAR